MYLEYDELPIQSFSIITKHTFLNLLVKEIVLLYFQHYAKCMRKLLKTCTMYMTLSSAVELCVMYALQIRGHYEIQNIFY